MPNIDQKDTDNNGEGDACDQDIDGDGQYNSCVSDISPQLKENTTMKHIPTSVKYVYIMYVTNIYDVLRDSGAYLLLVYFCCFSEKLATFKC